MRKSITNGTPTWLEGSLFAHLLITDLPLHYTVAIEYAPTSSATCAGGGGGGHTLRPDEMIFLK